jgi:hypothetical protein
MHCKDITRTVSFDMGLMSAELSLQKAFPDISMHVVTIDNRTRPNIQSKNIPLRAVYESRSHRFL